MTVFGGVIAWRERTVTVSDTGVPGRIGSARGSYFQRATFYGKLHARTNNTGSVYIGVNSTNNTQTIEVVSGGMVTIEAPAGSFYDLYDLYLDVATANDGVVVIYSYP